MLLMTPPPKAAPTGPFGLIWPSERRAFVRYAGDYADALIPSASCERLLARVLDLSENGVALLVSQPLETDKLLVVELHGAEGPAEWTLVARVVRVEKLGASRYKIACEFDTPLSDDEMQDLL